MRQAFDTTELSYNDKNKISVRPQSAKVEQTHFIQQQHYQQHQQQNFNEKQNNTFQDDQRIHQQVQSAKPPYQVDRQSSIDKKKQNPSQAQQKPYTANNNQYEYQKVVQRNNSQDKEKLYTDTLQLKEQENQILIENTKIKTRLLQFEKENLRLEKMIDQLEQTGKAPKHGQDSGYIVSSLKQQIAQCKYQLQLREDELQKLNKQPKYTKILETDTEIKALSDETIRLKHILEQILKQKMQDALRKNEFEEMQQKLKNQNQIIEQLKKDNVQMKQAYQSFQQQNQNFQRQLQETEARNKKENENLKQLMKQKEQDIIEVKNNIAQHQNSIKPVKKPSKIIINAGNLKQNQQTVLAEKNQRIKQLQDQINDLIKFSNKTEKKRTETAVATKQDDVLDQPNPEIKIEQTQSMQEVFISNEEVKEDNLNLVSPIQVDDVYLIGQEIQYRFMSFGLEWNELIQYMFPDQNAQFSIQEMQELLQQEPFLIKNPDNSFLLARYLVEGNQSEKYQLDLTKQTTIHEIIQKFCTVIEQYQVWSEEETEQLFLTLAEMLYVNKVDLIKSILSLNDNNQEFATIVQIKQAFDQIQIDLSDEQFEFLICSIISESDGLNKLNYNKLWEVFSKLPEIENDSQQNFQENNLNNQQDQQQYQQQYDQQYEQQYDQQQYDQQYEQQYDQQYDQQYEDQNQLKAKEEEQKQAQTKKKGGKKKKKGNKKKVKSEYQDDDYQLEQFDN